MTFERVDLSDSVTLYRGDCLEVLPTLERVDAVITDPPYPELTGGVKLYIPGTGVAKVFNVSETIGTPWNTSLDWMLKAWDISKLGMLVFCSWHSVDTVKQVLRDYAVGLITWHKRNSAPSINNVPHFTTEYVWAFKKAPGLRWRKLETFYDIPSLPGGCMGTERVKNDDGTTAHPTQKPIALLLELLKCNPASILDPFMGSGTTGVAAVKLGRKFVGIEIDQGYFDIAVRRVSEALAQPPLFRLTPLQADAARPGEAEQLALPTAQLKHDG